jgi:hypothetical protein
MLDLKDLYWLAGIIEGEGSMSYRTVGKYQYPWVRVAMTDEDVIRHCYEVSGIGYMHGPYLYNKRPNRKPIWQWAVAQQTQAVGLMMTLYTLMGERRQAQIRRVLDVWHHSYVPPERKTAVCPCGKPFYVADWELRQGNKRCSKDCGYRYKHNRNQYD